MQRFIKYKNRRDVHSKRTIRLGEKIQNIECGGGEILENSSKQERQQK